MLIYFDRSVCLTIIANKKIKEKYRRQKLYKKIVFIKKIDELAMNIP